MDETPTVAQALVKVRDARSAMAFIEWFAREWVTPIRDADGCEPGEVTAAEARLGLRLPESVAAFYRLLGKRHDLTSNQDRLIALNSLKVENGALVYRIENQGCAKWGVPVSGLTTADPPALIRGGPGDDHPWLPFLGSFSLAAVEIVLYEAMFNGPEGHDDNRDLSDEADIMRLESLYERLPFPDYMGWWDLGTVPGIRWFGGPGVLLAEHSRTWLWVRAQDPVSLARVREALPGEWLMTPG